MLSTVLFKAVGSKLAVGSKYSRLTLCCVPSLPEHVNDLFHGAEGAEAPEYPVVMITLFVHTF